MYCLHYISANLPAFEFSNPHRPLRKTAKFFRACRGEALAKTGQVQRFVIFSEGGVYMNTAGDTLNRLLRSFI